ncbi:hypothetical protein, partial [Arthrobacter sp. Cr_A7]|uniref:hypothetical protein n=1 Tax=Arthrobacter sp. Cr_A7 TaxID=3031017 RepID=UPI0023DCDFF8
MKNITRARWGAGLACLALVLAGTTGAQAVLPDTTFEGSDGNLAVTTAGNTDWDNVAGKHTGIDKPSGKTDNAFGQGTKEDNAAATIVTGSVPPNKNDLTRFYEASEQATNGDIFLYLGWERLVNIGNANLDFEINQEATEGFTASLTGPVTLNRTPGDLLINYDFGGSGTPTLGLNFWLTTENSETADDCYSANSLPCWGNHLALGDATVAEGAVDPVTGLFGEAAINLTDAGVFQEGVCTAFGSAFVKSRSSSSFTAELKDFIAPVDVEISNCGSITINKVTQNEPVPGTQSFAYTTSSNLTGFSLKNGESEEFLALPSGTYSVTEAAQTAPWSFVSLTCSTTTGVTITDQQVSIALGNGQHVSCTYTNAFAKAQPTVSTTQDLIPNDNFLLSGGLGSVTGTVTFSLYSPSDASCAGTPAYTQTVTVNGNGTYSTANTAFHATAEGTWRWASSYSGDAYNLGAASACGVEQFTIDNS